MGKESYTVLVVPKKSARVSRYHVSSKKIKGAIFSLAFIVLASAYMVYDYVTVKGQVWQVNTLLEENETQKGQLQAFANKISILENQMVKLRQFDAKLRVITNLETPKNMESYVGVGGPDEGKIFDYGQRRDVIVQQMHADIDNLNVEASVQEESFSELMEFLEDKKSMLASTPSIWPVRGWVTSNFGKRISPFTGKYKNHDGMDVATRTGTPIVSPADGRVTYVGVESGYGKLLVIDHGYGVVTRYGHNSDIFVKVGEKVKRGQQIAAIGNTGRSTGPHLHYEVRVNGVPVNPRNYILN